MMVYMTIRGDLTNSLFNLVGLFTVATNTGIRVWNKSTVGSGIDSKSKNVDFIRTVETNVVNNFYENVATVTPAVRPKEDDILPGPRIVLSETHNNVMATAYAMLLNYRSEDMEAGRFAEFGKDPAELVRAIVDATLATTKPLSRVLAEADYGNKKIEFMAISAYMCTTVVH